MEDLTQARKEAFLVHEKAREKGEVWEAAQAKRIQKQIERDPLQQKIEKVQKRLAEEEARKKELAKRLQEEEELKLEEWKDAGATDDLWSQPSRPGKAHAAQGGLGSIQFRDEMRAFHQDNMPEISFQGFMESLKEKAAEKSGLVAGSKESHRSFLRRAFRESPRPKHMPFNAWLKGLLSDEDEEMEDEEEGLEEAEGLEAEKPGGPEEEGMKKKVFCILIAAGWEAKTFASWQLLAEKPGLLHLDSNHLACQKKGKGVKKNGLTQENVKTHQELLGSSLKDSEQVSNAILALPEEEQQLLWKKFEHSRKSAGEQEDKVYKANTQGVGSLAKKRKLLVSWVLDKGELKDNYREAFLNMEQSTTNRVELGFKTWQQMKTKYGKAEALSRLKAGTIKWRHSPTDGRFMEFWDSDEKVITDKKKSTMLQLHAKGKAIKGEDWLKHDSMLMDDFQLEGLGAVNKKALENMEPELQQFFGENKGKKQKKTDKGEDSSSEESDASFKSAKTKKTKAKNEKWEVMSQVQKAEDKDTLKKKLVSFQAELTKDQAVLTEMVMDLKKDKDSKSEVKEAKEVMAQLEGCLKKLEAAKKNLKKEDCKAVLLNAYKVMVAGKKAKTNCRKKITKAKKAQNPSEEGCAITSKSIKASQLLLGCVPKSCKVAKTTQPWWDMLKDSFQYLAEGRLPNGKKVRRGVLMVIAGDLEWFNQEFKWPTASSNQCCVYCSADNLHEGGDYPFTDMRGNAKWKETIKGPEEAPHPHPIYGAPGVSWLTLKLDMLHMVDLGVASHTYGNVIWSIMEDELPGSSRGKRLASMNTLISNLYDELGVEASRRIKRLHQSDLASGDTEVSVKLCEMHAADNAGKHRLAACKHLAEMYRLSRLEDYKWKPADQIKFQKAVEVFLAHYGWLAKHAMEQGQCRWSIVLKHHLCAHYPSQCKHLAPRLCWCYAPESFMGVMIKIASASVHGTKAWKLPQKVVSRFAFAWHMMQLGLLEVEEDS
ncbi:Uncharacterized protein SCF082_LOCUS27961 [Durusdinium trenchii]|uniref:Uncharacterized protein n=1 Tax=Durusdinium trenchii TaxID=1381693 RepID=A0ABP0MI08_9DINO